MAKKQKAFLPRKIAGVKVPKKVRNGQFGELLASPTGQKLIAQALIAGGALVAGKKAADSDTAKAAVRGAKDKVAGAKDRVAEKVSDKVAEAGIPALDAGALSYAFAEAARAFAEALHRGEGSEVRSFERSWAPLDTPDASETAANPPGAQEAATP
jgi:hypothetical protein